MDKKDWIFLGIYLVLGLCVSLWRIDWIEADLNSNQILNTATDEINAKMLFDEIYYVPTAIQMLQGKPWFERSHPFMGKYWIAGSIGLFGNRAWAWRLPSVLFGVGLILLVYLLTKATCHSRATAVLASFLALFETNRIGLSRIATLDTQVSFWVLLGLLFFYLSLTLKRDRYLYLTGFAFGMGAATCFKE